MLIKQSHVFVFALALYLSILLPLSLQHTCIHDDMEHDIKIADSSYSLYPETESRVLADYNNIRILLDDSTLINVTDDFRTYITGYMMPVVQNYFEATLKVPTASSKLKAGGYSTLCSGDVNVPSFYNTDGVDGDLVIFLRAKSDPTQNYVASATACLLEVTNKRPVFGRINFNLAQMKATNNPASRERDLMTVLHEITHVLGFSGSLFRYYINPATGNFLSGHVKTKTVLGFQQTVINLPPLTTRLQKHFNCSSMDGAYIENQGGSGSAGSHFERRIFYNEYMTASAIIDTRVTEFTLALLEGSGWYQVDYSMAENITYGKNRGCNFINGDCVNRNTKQANFPEFCSPVLTKTCSWTGRAGSSCGSYQTSITNVNSAINYFGDGTTSADIFSDNCPTRLPYTDLDCEDPDNGNSPTIGGEAYGYGSKCFMGTLYPRGTLATPYPYCFKPACLSDGANGYYVRITIGSGAVNCYSAGNIGVPGYNGYLTCPDPQQFCSQQLTEGFCRRKCSARGTCVNNVCQCQDGWTGDDCSYQVKKSNCSQCQSDPFRISCYGDSCYCDPSNTYCLCGLGLLNSSACVNVTANVFTDPNSITIPGSTSGRFSEQNNPQAVESKNNILIPAIAGVVCGIICIVLAYFIWKHSKAIRKAFSGLRRINSQEIKVTNSKNPINLKIAGLITLPDNMSQNGASPDATHRSNHSIPKSGMDSFENSPITYQNSPSKTRLHAPSTFSRFANNNTPQRRLDSEQKEFELKIEPVDYDKSVVTLNLDKIGYAESDKALPTIDIERGGSNCLSGEISQGNSRPITAQEIRIVSVDRPLEVGIEVLNIPHKISLDFEAEDVPQANL